MVFMMAAELTETPFLHLRGHQEASSRVSSGLVHACCKHRGDHIQAPPGRPRILSLLKVLNSITLAKSLLSKEGDIIAGLGDGVWTSLRAPEPTTEGNISQSTLVTSQF